MSGSIGVVIPTFNEAARIGTRIDELRDQADIGEIVVVDGGSTDGTPGVCAQKKVRCLASPAGRGRQLALGAATINGDILLFLHADTHFPQGAAAAIVAAMAAQPQAVGGNFRLLFDGEDAFARWLNGFYAFIRRLGLYYGDSALFVRRAVYDSLGGIRPIALMEDYDFVRRMERSGPTLNIQYPALLTSSRRFRGRRPLAIVWGWVVIHVLFWCGVSPERLARMYDTARQRENAQRTSAHR